MTPWRRILFLVVVLGLGTVALTSFAAEKPAQTSPVQRTFRAPKKAVDQALRQLQPAMSGHLPTLEGFVLVGEHPLTQYQRAFYQCTAEVTETPAGSVVRISANVTAWHKDASPSHSAYEALKSNGRLESDLLDQLSDQLSGANSGAASAGEKSADSDARRPSASSPSNPASQGSLPDAPSTDGTFSASAAKALPAQPAAARRPIDDVSDKKSADLRAELSSLEDAIRNQSHPKNLVAIKKSGTPVVASPSLTAKTLFLADAQDEFEMLDFTDDWVHVRVSGLSRGWIWRTSLEMPQGIPDVATARTNSAPAAADLFQVSREEVASFPGDWAPLRGKSVKIISVQKIREDEKDSGPNAKLEFAKSLLDSNYEDLAKIPDLAGLVLIFDSADGGLVAATLPTIRKWKAGGLTDAALWHQCYFDPPETFTVSSATVGR